MNSIYEFDGQMFESDGAFLDAVAREYTHGDTQAALDALEEYGFSVSDIGVRP